MKEPFKQFMEEELKPGTLLIACGLPGTYKTETTAEVSKSSGTTPETTVTNELLFAAFSQGNEVTNPTWSNDFGQDEARPVTGSTYFFTGKK